MSEALVISGDAETVATRIRDIPNYGVDEIIAMPLQLPDDPTSFQRTVEVLGNIAKGK
jgi:hypothetical protein